MLQQLGKYRIDAVLGKGAMGVVYKAFDPDIERIVALKTVRKELFGDYSEVDLMARFKNEAQAAGRLMHPNIVAVYDYGEDAGTTYIAMEFVTGRALDSFIDAARPVRLDVVVSWMTQLLHALDYAHARGIVHRDIKPANLLVTDDGQLKVTDFGIARIESSKLTHVGAVIGTPSYMSPEQFCGETVDRRSDVFSAGVVLYQLLMGTRPFTGTAPVVMQQILNDTPMLPSLCNPVLGDVFDSVIMRAMAKQPVDRYASAQSMLDALLAAYHARSAQQGSLSIDSDETVMLAHCGLAHASVALRPYMPLSDTQTDQMPLTTLSQWKLDVLPELESIFSTQVGPVARILLKKAAAQATDMDQLCESLLTHISAEADRSHFIGAVATLKKKLRIASSSAASSTLRSGTSSALQGGTPIDAVVQGNAEKKLTPYIGPIAKIVVKRAAAKAANLHEFHLLLADSLPSEQEKQRFMAEIGALS